jgi:hypothetical protein
VTPPKSNNFAESSWFGHLRFVHLNLFVIGHRREAVVGLVIGHSRLQTRSFISLDP